MAHKITESPSTEVTSPAGTEALPITGTKYITLDTIKGWIQDAFDLVYAAISDVLTKTNITAFTPTSDYHPATKKYVDDTVAGAGGYTDENAQDAVGAMIADTATIDLTYTDATPQLKADVKTGSILTSHLGISGTSFPGSPATNDLFFRTDRGLLYFYDGTRWLTTTLYTHHLPNADNIGGTTNTLIAAVWLADYDMYVQDLYATMYASGLSGSAYWTLNLYYFDGGTQGSAIASVTNQSGTSSSFERKKATINALIGTAKDNIAVTWVKTSTPGNLFAGAFLTYRLVG